MKPIDLNDFPSLRVIYLKHVWKTNLILFNSFMMG